MSHHTHRGYILIYTLVFGSIIALALGGFATWGSRYLRVVNHTLYQEEAARISDAGIEYYKWHLAHAPTDYTNGTGNPGPYVIPYKDKDGNTIGTYTLTITPPVTGSDIVTVKSEGVSATDPTAKKTITIQLSRESVAHYAVLSQSSLFFPTGTEIFGAVHSNGGIRFDGLAHNVVTSAQSTYRDGTHGSYDDDEDDDQDEDDEDDDDEDEDDEGGNTICHIPPGNPGNRNTIHVGNGAVAAHLGHGDHTGSCDNDNDDHDDDGDGNDNDNENEDHHDGGDDNDDDGDGEDDDHESGNGYEYAVHTHKTSTDSLPPAALTTRADVFLAGRQFPVASVDLDSLTQSLSTLKSDAQASGFYRASSGDDGYHVVLKNDDTFDLYKVTSLTNAPSGCSGDGSLWGTWSVGTQTLLGNYPFPTNNTLYFEDNTWVDGTINSARLTIVAAEVGVSESNYKNIIIGNNLNYTTYTGTDALALIAQDNVLVAMTAPSTLRIDGALIAKEGSVTRLGYRAPEGGNNRCSPYHSRTAITTWGMIAAKDGFSLKKTDGTGFQTQSIYYDGNLTTTPPPGMPSLAPEYKVISYEES